MKKTFTTFALMLFLGLSLFAQNDADVRLAKSELAKQATELGLNTQSIEDYLVSDHYVSSYHNATHLYLWQTVEGVPVYNGLITIGIKDNKVYNLQSNAVKHIATKLNTGAANLDAEAAIRAAAEALNIQTVESFQLLAEKRSNSFVYAPTSFAQNDIPVYLCYDKNEDDQYEISWNVDLDVAGSDYWSLRVSAIDGRLLSKNNYTVYCNMEDMPLHRHSKSCTSVVQANGSNETNSALVDMMMDGSYRVYPAPAESPNHGSHDLIVNPADSVASPFGWHDTNGEEGAEFTITRGNNVHAYADTDFNDQSDGNEPDGGMDLIFDFEHDTALEPTDNTNAAQVNLFYMNNFIHDFTYRYGFDEAAGNFQVNNYGNGGAANDYVQAESADGGGTNNANFGTPPDGGNGRMQMFLWGASDTDLLNVNSPEELEGIYAAQPAGFGAQITATPVTGNLVFVDDGTSEGTLGCDPPINGDELTGNIAMIDRGSCEFGLKALQAEEAGAIGVIVCNVVGVNGGDGTEVITMGAGAVGAQVTIPAVMINVPNCNLLRASLTSGIPVNATLQTPQITGPSQLNGSFDNGIVAHEFGHGVSNRLTGGPSQAGCLSNDEQMGEGWSDFFSLVSSVEPGDAGTDARGIGTYAIGQDTDGRGIRTFPYSTDMEIYPKTYDDIIGTGAPHPLGEVWAAVTWDLYWAMVDEYGYDADINNLESGNARAIRLVIEGMKEQACSPGFVRGREGILAADEAIYEGENFCLIYNVFARRGVGFDAVEGSTANRNDNTEGFLSHPLCLDELLIAKTATPIVAAGEEILVDITVTNYKKDPVTDLTVTDQIPEGAVIVDGSSNYPATVVGDVVSFDIGAVAENDVITVSYKLLASAAVASTTLYFNDFSGGTSGWDIEIGEGGAESFWQLTDQLTSPGDLAFYVNDNAVEATDVRLYSTESFEITGTRPALRFDNYYDTELAVNGGFVEVREAGEESWTRLSFDNNIRNGYNVILAYGGTNAFAIPSLAGFSGNSDGFVDTYLNLTEYIGKTIEFRFRFGTNELTSGSGAFPGWAIDNFEILDLDDFRGEACASAGGDDPVCASAATIIESDGLTALYEVSRDDFSMELFPNPTDNFVNVRIVAKAAGPANLRLITLDGKMVKSEDINVTEGFNIMEMEVSDLPKGMYFVELSSEVHHSIQKLVIE